ncbi:hypothetical protein ScPMuIL_000890 [Solemya velum]
MPKYIAKYVATFENVLPVYWIVWPPGTGLLDCVAPGTGLLDSVAPGTGLLDCVAPGTGLLDCVAPGTGLLDCVAPGTGLLDCVAPGTGLLDCVAPGTGLLDCVAPGTGLLDCVASGTGLLDCVASGTGLREIDLIFLLDNQFHEEKSVIRDVVEDLLEEIPDTDDLEAYTREVIMAGIGDYVGNTMAVAGYLHSYIVSGSRDYVRRILAGVLLKKQSLDLDKIMDAMGWVSPTSEFGCTEDQYRCKNSRCIPITWVCDETVDCFYGDDELPSCVNVTCPSTRCGRCIKPEWECNGVDDCHDGSDESPEMCAGSDTGAILPTDTPSGEDGSTGTEALLPTSTVNDAADSTDTGAILPTDTPSGEDGSTNTGAILPTSTVNDAAGSTTVSESQPSAAMPVSNNGDPDLEGSLMPLATTGSGTYSGDLQTTAARNKRTDEETPMQSVSSDSQSVEQTPVLPVTMDTESCTSGCGLEPTESTNYASVMPTETILPVGPSMVPNVDWDNIRKQNKWTIVIMNENFDINNLDRLIRAFEDLQRNCTCQGNEGYLRTKLITLKSQKNKRVRSYINEFVEP